ncbi:hypothetical protein, partial [Couchioplanes caeruleus]|uniref:hypothetical protein n=1 Tax=Couchioplanes caeruleus TaxID=56438 RepID=UPI000A76562A
MRNTADPKKLAEPANWDIRADPKKLAGPAVRDMRAGPDRRRVGRTRQLAGSGGPGSSPGREDP